MGRGTKPIDAKPQRLASTAPERPNREGMFNVAITRAREHPMIPLNYAVWTLQPQVAMEALLARR